jgi:hypothetical protein
MKPGSIRQRAGPEPQPERGQASVELLAVVPAVLLLGLGVWQLAVAGHSAWLCANAARVAARAEIVGGDAVAAARGALPAALERDLRVERDPREPGRVRVAVTVPLLGRWSSPIEVDATADLGTPVPLRGGDG